MGLKRLLYRGSRRVKTEECKDHRLYSVTLFLFILVPTACFTSVSVFITIPDYV